jgi:DNA repair exonuclease SbcCD ATPase subunit
MNASKIDRWRETADEAMAARAAAHTRLKRARQAVVEAEAEYDAADQAQQIVQAVAETIQEEAHDRIAGVVSRCLATVFEEPYEFRIHFERARGRTEAQLVFVRDDEEYNPIDSSGGGVVDVAAFALRLSCLMLARPARRRVVVLDEPFKFVSADRRANVRAMLEGLAADLGVQFIMVTHIDELRCGHIVEIDE